MKLPPEIVDLIFQYITPFRLDLRLICKAFDVAGKRHGGASSESLCIVVEKHILMYLGLYAAIGYTFTLSIMHQLKYVVFHVLSKLLFTYHQYLSKPASSLNSVV